MYNLQTILSVDKNFKKNGIQHSEVSACKVSIIPVYEVVPDVVPDPVVSQLHAIAVLGVQEVLVGVSACVPATPNIPEHGRGCRASTAFCQVTSSKWFSFNPTLSRLIKIVHLFK